MLSTCHPGAQLDDGKRFVVRAGLVVSDIEAARVELVRHGIDASEVWHGP